MANGIPYELKAPDPNWLASYIGYITFCKNAALGGWYHTYLGARHVQDYWPGGVSIVLQDS